MATAIPVKARWLVFTANVGLVLAAVLTILPFVGLCFYANPSSDDYWMTNKLIEHGFWGSQWWWYQQWTGRFTFCFLVNSYIATIGIDEHYWVVSLSGFALVYAAIYGFIGSVVRRSVSRRVRLLWTTVLMAIYLAHAASPGEMYWLTGITIYQASVVLFLLLMTLLITASRCHASVHLIVIGVACCALAFVVAGSSETIMAIMAWALAAGTIVVWREGRPARWVWAATLVAGLVGSAVVVFAPGNDARLAVIAEVTTSSLSRRTLLVPLSLGLIARWITFGTVLLATMLFMPFACTLAHQYQKQGFHPSKWLRWAVILGGLAVLFGFAPSIYGSGGFNDRNTKPPVPSGHLVVVQQRPCHMHVVALGRAIGGIRSRPAVASDGRQVPAGRRPGRSAEHDRGLGGSPDPCPSVSKRNACPLGGHRRRHPARRDRPDRDEDQTVRSHHFPRRHQGSS